MGIQQASLFLVNVLFSLFIFALILRFILQLLQANYYNPVCQLVINVTNPVVTPLKGIVPRTRLFDLSTIIAIVIFEFIKVLCLFFLQGKGLNLDSLVIYAIADLISQTLNIFFFAIIIRVIVSWINPASPNPALDVVRLLTDSILIPIQRFIPPISGFDLSPVFALIALKLIEIMIVNSLFLLAYNL